MEKFTSHIIIGAAHSLFVLLQMLALLILPFAFSFYPLTLFLNGLLIVTIMSAIYIKAKLPWYKVILFATLTATVSFILTLAYIFIWKSFVDNIYINIIYFNTELILLIPIALAAIIGAISNKMESERIGK